MLCQVADTLARYLTENYGKDSRVTAIVDHTEVHTCTATTHPTTLQQGGIKKNINEINK